MSKHTSRRARVLTVAALSVAALTLVGCSSSSKTSTSSKSASSAKSAEPRAITASARQSHDVATAIRGQTFTVQLPTASGSEYAWRLAPASADDKFVDLEDLQQQQNPSNDMPGAPAADVFTFRADRVGQTTLTFIYDRPWNNNAPPRTFTLDVDVYKNAKTMAQANAESSMPE